MSVNYRWVGIGFTIFLFIFVSILWDRQGSSISAQDSLEGSVTPIYDYIADDPSVFPDRLACSGSYTYGRGPSFNGVTVGVSSAIELETLVELWSDHYSIGRLETNGTEYQYRYTLSDASDNPDRLAPPWLDVCLHNNIVTALRFPIADLDIEDLVQQYGLPDAITWTIRYPTERVAFWFEHGIAAELETHPGVFGRVLFITYFPFQSLEGYEQRWPYSRTMVGQSLDESLRQLYSSDEFDEIYGQENPFNLSLIASTATVQPSRTPTPTFTPRPKEG
jgi:hypothetical protein